MTNVPDSRPSVAQAILEDNPWYTGSQFEWANKPWIKPIYAGRHRYFAQCIERAKQRRSGELPMLDAGCGDGYWLATLQGIEGIRLSGIDYNPLRVERAQQAVPHLSVRCQSLLDYPEEARFEIILCSQVIEHLADDMSLLRKLHALLVPGGTLILGTPNQGSPLARWRDQRYKRRGFITDHVQFYTEPVIRHKIGAAGFSIDSVLREVFFPGDERLQYPLTKRRWGFRLLEILTVLMPWQCSDFYFECRALEAFSKEGPKE
jgi:SAM-dependent methyltransferase